MVTCHPHGECSLWVGIVCSLVFPMTFQTLSIGVSSQSCANEQTYSNSGSTPSVSTSDPTAVVEADQCSESADDDVESVRRRKAYHKFRRSMYFQCTPLFQMILSKHGKLREHWKYLPPWSQLHV